MGTNTSQDGQLYKPADEETGYGDDVNAGFDRVDSSLNQVVMIMPNGIDIVTPVALIYVFHVDELPVTAKWSLGLSDRYDFDTLNSTYGEATAPDRSTVAYYSTIDLGDQSVDRDNIGIPADLSPDVTDSHCMLKIWDQVDGTWVVIGTGWCEIVVDVGPPPGP